MKANFIEKQWINQNHNALFFHKNIIQQIQYNNIMKIRKISNRLTRTQQTAQFQLKHIKKIEHIINLKRKAEVDYKQSLQNIKTYTSLYIEQGNSFMTEIVSFFQTYISLTCQNQSILIDGYDQIIALLTKDKQIGLQSQVNKKVQFIDKKMEQYYQQIKNYKELLRVNWTKIQYLLSKTDSKSIHEMQLQSQQNQISKDLSDLLQARKYMEYKIQQEVDSLMQLSVEHHSTLQMLKQYQSVYIQKRALNIYDNFMRAFVIQASFNKSTEHDFFTILKQIGQNNDKIKKFSLTEFQQKSLSQSTLKSSLWNTYMKITSPRTQFDLNGPYISANIREKWKKVCQYYNEAKF